MPRRCRAGRAPAATREEKEKKGVSGRRRGALVDLRHVPRREDDPERREEERDQPAEDRDCDQYANDGTEDKRGDPEDDEGDDVVHPADCPSMLKYSTENRTLIYTALLGEPDGANHRDECGDDRDGGQDQETEIHSSEGWHEYPRVRDDHAHRHKEDDHDDGVCDVDGEGFQVIDKGSRPVPTSGAQVGREWGTGDLFYKMGGQAW